MPYHPIAAAPHPAAAAPRERLFARMIRLWLEHHRRAAECGMPPS